jgi:predicted flap endonuclease-1-like 5' DNA nuclease
MWDVMLRRWLDLLFWWVPKKDQTSRRAEQAPRERAPEPARRPAEPGPRPAPKQPAQQPAQAEGRGAKAAEPSARPAAKPSPAQPAPAAKAGAPGAAEPSAPPAPKPAPAQPEKTVAPPVPDDLTVIKGIGPAVQNKLRGLGITTFADLAAADPDAILRGLKGSQPLTKGKVQAWTDAARERART